MERCVLRSSATSSNGRESGALAKVIIEVRYKTSPASGKQQQPELERVAQGDHALQQAYEYLLARQP